MAKTAALDLPSRDDWTLAEARPVRALPTNPASVISAGIEQAVRAVVYPALLRRHRGLTDPRPPSLAEIRRLATLSIGCDETAFRQCFDEVTARNRAFSTTLVDFVAPVARSLGELWTADACNFFDVTIGVGRLQAAMDDLASETSAPLVDPPRRALLVAVAEDAHVFGIRMVGKLFEAAGWDVVLDTAAVDGVSAERVSAEWFAVIGVSVGTTADIGAAARTIARVRRNSLNPRIGVLVGGNALNAEPDPADRCGADGFGADGPAAVEAAQSLLRNQVVSRTI